MATIIGDNNDNFLIGNNSVSDAIYGLGGHDIINPLTHDKISNAGPDTVDGGDGVDRLNVIAPGETMYLTVNLGLVTSGSNNFSVLASNMEALYFQGGSGDDIINSTGVVGRPGVDLTYLYGGAGFDKWEVNFAGTHPNDSFVFNLNSRHSLVGRGYAHFTGIEQVSIVTGAHNDNLTGGQFTDSLVSGGGNDILNPGAKGIGKAFDYVDGGDGIDTIVVDARSETMKVEYNTFGGLLHSDSDNFGALTSNIEKVYFLGGSGADEMVGLALNDTFKGNGGADKAFGAAGTDTLYGGADNDILIGGDGKDYLYGEAGKDTLAAAGGEDYLNGGTGDDVLTGIGASAIYGGTGTDTVDYELFAGRISVIGHYVSFPDPGGGAYDYIDGVENFVLGAGDDFVNGVLSDTGSIYLNGGMGKDKLNGSAGDDRLVGGLDDDVLIDGNGNDKLDGGEGKDALTGGAGSDNLTGGSGDDRLFGGQGFDAMTGGTGADDFIYATAADSGGAHGPADRITDFTPGLDDIDLRNVVIDSNPAQSTFAFLAAKGAAFTGHPVGQVRWYQSSGNTFVEVDTNGNRVADIQIMLLGLKTLTAGDFLL